MSTTPNLGMTYLTSGQLQPEVTVNEDLTILDSALGGSPIAFSNNAATTSGLTFGYFGGNIYSNGANIAIASGTVALTANATNYIQRTAAGIVSVNTTGFTNGLIPMATVVAGASTITSIADNRPAWSDLRGRQVIAVAATNITLTDAQVNARILSFQGTLTANVVVTFPTYQQEWIVSNETTGAFSLQVQTAGGSPLTVLQGTARFVYGNGTLVKPADNPSPGYIDGLQMQWVNATAVTVSSGRAYIPGLGYYLDAPNAIALTGLVLTASTFYHLYLYSNAGVPAVECVTTAPAAAYNGTARAKTGDTSRRYIGSVRTDTSGNLMNFLHTPSSGAYLYKSNINNNGLYVLNNGGSATPVNIDCSAVIPASGVLAFAYLENTDVSNTAEVGTPDVANIVANVWTFVRKNGRLSSQYMLSNVQLSYVMTGASAAGTGLSIWILGYTYER